MKTILIYSGGLDSTVLLYHLKKDRDIVAIGIDYGQRHSTELVAAGLIAEKLGIPFKPVDLSAIRNLLGSSSQTNSNIPVPHGHYTAESMKQTVVPNRNMIMLSVAIGIAVTQKADSVAYGAHSGDHAIYPDCREEFASAMNTAALLADWHKVRLERPFIDKTKADIVKLGATLDVPFGETWSCYEGGVLHCGKCGTCVERREAFQLANHPDPTLYRN